MCLSSPVRNYLITGHSGVDDRRHVRYKVAKAVSCHHFLIKRKNAFEVKQSWQRQSLTLPLITPPPHRNTSSHFSGGEKTHRPALQLPRVGLRKIKKQHRIGLRLDTSISGLSCWEGNWSLELQKCFLDARKRWQRGGIPKT